MTFLLAPGEYEASFGDVEFPDGTYLDVVGNVDNRPSGSAVGNKCSMFEKLCDA